MANITNTELVHRIYVASDEGRIDWQPTAKPREFTASFGGKWSLVLYQTFDEDLISVIEVRDSEGELIVRIDSHEDSRLEGLHEMARRHALKVNEALADLLNEIDKPKN